MKEKREFWVNKWKIKYSLKAVGNDGGKCSWIKCNVQQALQQMTEKCSKHIKLIVTIWHPGLIA